MARAIRLAANGRYSTHPNPCVGCILVRQGEIVGEGCHWLAGEAHAEAIALEAAGSSAAGATAYVSLEPCSFHGRTPACAGALIDAGVSRVVVAMLDPDKRNSGRGIKMLEDAGIEVRLPLLEQSARRCIRGHVKRLTLGRPYVRLKLAMTLDGKTALADGESKWLTSPEARADVQRLRAMSGALVTGVQTVIDDDPALSVRANELAVPRARLAAGVTRPVYILDSHHRLPADARLLGRDSTVVVAISPPVRQMPVEVLVVPSHRGRVDLTALLAVLAGRQHSEVLFECGATLAGAMVGAGLVDELIVYMAPALMGAGGKSLLNLPEIDKLSGLTRLAIEDVRRVGQDFRITAMPQNTGDRL